MGRPEPPARPTPADPPAASTAGGQHADTSTSVSRLKFSIYVAIVSRMSRGERVEAEFVLTDAERAQLLRWSHGESARLAVRAKIVLACAEPGVVYEQLAGELGVTTMTVGAWRKRFARSRCDGLVDGLWGSKSRPRSVTCGDRRSALQA